MEQLKRIQAALPRFPAPALLLTSRTNRFYATGFSSSSGALFITPDLCRFVTDSRYSEAARAAMPGIAVDCMARGEKWTDYVVRYCQEAGTDVVCYEDETMTVAEHAAAARAIPADLWPVRNALSYLRAQKLPDELAHMRAAQAITEQAFNRILSDIRPGITEKALAARLIFHLYDCGGDALAFAPIVVSGKNSALPHGCPTEKKIEAGDFITMDFGAVYAGYCADMTRTVAVGAPDADMRHVYAVVLEAQRRALAAIHAGVSWKAVDAAARDYITEKGFGDYFGHGVGHGLGIEVHESFAASEESADILPENAVVSCEPGIYLPGRFGVRIEDCVVATDGGHENLTHTEKELLII